MTRKMSRKKPESSVGIDIGSHSIKVAALKEVSGDRVLTAYNIKNRRDIKEKGGLRSQISEALAEIDLSPTEVNLSISGPDVIVRFINFPKMTPEQLKSALIFEAEKYIPFNVSEVVLDSVILGDSTVSGNMKVLLAAAKRSPVEAMVNELDAMGISVNVMDINAFASLNAFTSSGTVSPGQSAALLDIGHSRTDFMIVVDNTPCFMRQIQIGGRDIDALISRNLSVGTEKAMEYKMGIGEFDAGTVSQAVSKVIDDISREIHLSFGYFENEDSRNTTVESICCSGGMICRDGVLEDLAKKLGMPTRVWDPFTGIKMADVISRKDLDSISSRLAVSVGLALRG